MTTKEKCDAIVNALHERYGGDKMRLESLTTMGNTKQLIRLN